MDANYMVLVAGDKGMNSAEQEVDMVHIDQA
jgi:hypothetical protein